MAYETIKYEVAEQILTITLNRPDKLNAFNGTMQQEMIDAFDAADKDDNIRAIIGDVVRSLGLTSRVMPSGAGHDAQSMAVLGPIGMIFVPSVAETFGLHVGDVVVSIHCGSRGLGHQIGTEFLKRMAVAAWQSGIELPDRDWD